MHGYRFGFGWLVVKLVHVFDADRPCRWPSWALLGGHDSHPM
jgi:hypothetical protein